MNFSECKIRFLNIKGEDMPDSEYYSLKGFTSISRLKLLDPRHGGSPQKYSQGFDFGYNESLLLGSAVHAAILQPDDFEISDYQNKPAGKLGFFVEKVYENRKSGMKIVDSIEKASIDANYYAGKLTKKILRNAMKLGLDYYLRLSNGEFNPENGKEKFVLSKKLYDSAHACINSINRNGAIQRILSQNLFEPKEFYNEIALFSDIEVVFPDGVSTIIRFKGKLDSVVWDPEKKILYLNDIKTTSKGLSYFMGYIYNDVPYDGVFEHRSYYTQLYIYSVLLQMYFQKILGIDDYTLYTNIFAVETTGEYRSESFRINNSYIELGKKEFKELMVRLAWHTTYGFDKDFPE